MTYVDTNVIMYAVGRPHPLRDEVRERLATNSSPLLASAEVLQELLHAYLPVKRYAELDAAFVLVTDLTTVLDTTFANVRMARELARTVPSLAARGLIHLALALEHGVETLWTYDAALADAFRRNSR